MSMFNKTALVLATIAFGAAFSQAASAATTSKTLFLDPSVACQLSIPTVDTSVRPRATGYRNEGATNAFVICGVGHLAPGGTGNATLLEIQFNQFDGVAKNFNCTGVNRQSSGSSPVYLTKPASYASSGSVEFAAAELGNFTGFASSVTCILPPGAGITGIRLNINDEIGL